MRRRTRRDNSDGDGDAPKTSEASVTAEEIESEARGGGVNEKNGGAVCGGMLTRRGGRRSEEVDVISSSAGGAAAATDAPSALIAGSENTKEKEKARASLPGKYRAKRNGAEGGDVGDV